MLGDLRQLLAECVEDLDGVEAIGLCSIVATDTRQGHWLEHLEGMERGIFAVHFDRDKTTGARAEVARHNFYGAGASGKQQGLAQGMVAYFGEGARDAIEQFRVLDIDGAHDLNDWHKAGELEDAIPTWLDATSTLDIDVSHEWRECLNESVHAHVQDTLERAEQREAERAKGAYINPLDAPEVIELSGVEARIKRELTDTLTHGGIKAIAITPGSGKTTITARYMSPALLSGEVKALDWASPSITVRDELASKLREGLEGHGMTHERRLLEHQMSPLPTRSDESCYMFDVWTAASRANPEGGNVICSGCEHHIQNTSGKGLCPYWQSVQARGGSGRVRTMTSEKLVRSHGYIANVPGLEPEQVEKDVEIKWSAIASLARGGGKFRPHLRESPSCILLELVRDEEGGEELALEVEEITTDDVEGTTLYRLTKDGREQLLAWFANIFDCEATPESVREAASAAIASAAPSSVRSAPMSAWGSTGAGSALGSSPIRATGRPSATTRTVAAMTATSDSGIARWIRGSTTITAATSTVTSSAGPASDQSRPRTARKAATGGEDPGEADWPRAAGTCCRKMIAAIPRVKPSITGHGMIVTSRPQRLQLQGGIGHRVEVGVRHSNPVQLRDRVLDVLEHRGAQCHAWGVVHSAHEHFQRPRLRNTAVLVRRNEGNSVLSGEKRHGNVKQSGQGEVQID